MSHDASLARRRIELKSKIFTQFQNRGRAFAAKIKYAGSSVVIRRHRPSGYVRCDPANSDNTPSQSTLYGGHPVSETKMNVPKKKKKKKKKKKSGVCV
jgi:hypothetical protein